jgi:hypothetical protein
MGQLASLAGLNARQSHMLQQVVQSVWLHRTTKGPLQPCRSSKNIQHAQCCL